MKPVKPAKIPRPPRNEDRPRWRRTRCGYWLCESKEIVDDPFCPNCDGGAFRPAPSLAVERCERAVLRAAMLWTGRGGSSWLTLGKATKALRAAQARARRARSAKP